METTKQLKRNVRLNLEPSNYLKKDLPLVNIELYQNSTFNFMHLEQYIININFKINEKYNASQDLYNNYLINNIVIGKRCKLTLNYNEMKKQKSKEYLRR